MNAHWSPKLLLPLVLAGLSLAVAQGSNAQTVLVGFEGGTPFANVPAGGGFPAVTLARLGDSGAVNNTFGIDPTQGTQFAVLTTFSNGGGTYAPGSPLFGGPGAVAGGNVLWNSLFPGSATNPLTGLGAVSGSTLSFTISMGVGDTFAFDWRFLTSEPASGGNADAAFVGVRLGNTGDPQQFSVLSQPGAGLVPTPGGVLNFDSMDSAWSTFSFTAGTAGTYTFGVGIMDAFFEGTQSALLLDNMRYTLIPEPSTVALLCGAGLLGLSLRRRRK